MFFCNLVADSFLDQLRHESSQGTPELGDLTHDARAEVGIFLGGHHEYGLDARLHLAVHQRHLQLELVVTHRANPPQHRVGVFLDTVGDQQALKNIDGHIVELGGHRLQHVFALFHVEQSFVLVEVAGNRHNEPVEELAATMDQVQVAVRNRVERSGIDGDDILQETSERREFMPDDFIPGCAQRQSRKENAAEGPREEGPAARCLLAPGGWFGSRMRCGFCIGRRGLRLVLHRDQAERLAYVGLDLRGDVLVFLQELLGVLPALADAFALVAEPRTRLLHQVSSDRQVEQVAFARDTFAIHHVELGFAERRCGLVLHDFYPGARAHHLVAILDGANSADIDAHRRVKLQRAPAGCGFRVAEHHANFFTDLVDEYQAGVRLGDDGGEFAQRLRHQAGLQANMTVAHFPVEFGLGHQGGHRVNDQHVDGAGTHQSLGDLQRLFAIIGLRDQQVVHIDAQLGRVDGVEGVLGIHEGGHASLLLRFANHLQRDGGFARRLRPEDLDHAPAREAADAQRRVKRNGSGGDHGDGDDRTLAPQLHDGAFAELLFDLRHGQVDGPAFFRSFVCHECRSLAARSRRSRNPGGPLEIKCDGSVRQAPWKNWSFAIRGAWGPDAELYIRLNRKSEEIANLCARKY